MSNKNAWGLALAGRGWHILVDRTSLGRLGSWLLCGRDWHVFKCAGVICWGGWDWGGPGTMCHIVCTRSVFFCLLPGLLHQSYPIVWQQAICFSVFYLQRLYLSVKPCENVQCTCCTIFRSIPSTLGSLYYKINTQYTQIILVSFTTHTSSMRSPRTGILYE